LLVLGKVGKKSVENRLGIKKSQKNKD